MTDVWDLIVKYDVLFTIVGVVSVVTLTSSLLFVAVLAARDWLRRRRTPRIPAPPPMPPFHACPELLRLRDEHIRAELRILGAELRADDDLHLATLDALFSDHTD